jgi:cytochrome P450
MIQSDPPDHTRLRYLVRQAFTPRDVDKIRPCVQAIVDDLLDAVEATRHMDLVADLAYPLPIIVVSEVLGVPTSDRHQILKWDADMLGLQATGGAQTENARRAARSIVEIEEYFRQIVWQRRDRPQDDLISHMIAAQEAGDVLSNDEMINICVNFLLAGHETTRSLITNGVLTLLRQPDQFRDMRSDRSLLAAAVEEILRYESPIQRAWRRITEDTKFGGETFQAGQLVLIMLGAANRDPAHFSEPERFDIRRQDNRHLAFGYGIHFCIGAPLARVEGTIAIEALLQRFPNLHLAGPFEWFPSIHVRGPVTLPLAF